MRKQKSKTPITDTWLKARQYIQDKNWGEAEQALDMGILMLSKYSLDGNGDKELIEGIKMETWYERFWVSIEKYIWPFKPDYEKNWKM